MRVETEFVMLFDAVRWLTVSAGGVPPGNWSSENWSRSPSRALWPICTSAETLRPRFANRCRRVRRFERLSPVVWLWVSLSDDAIAEPDGELFSAKPRLRL